MQRAALRPLPDNKHPVGTRCIMLDIPDDDDWERAAYSELYQLAMWMLWYRNDDRDGTKVAKLWKKALRSWRHCDGTKLGSLGVDEGSEDMIRQNPDNPCLLESSINGVDWCKFADISLCKDFGQQPGAGSSQPPAGGGTANYCSTLQANSKLLIPGVFNTGDVISIDATGLGNDGGHTEWYCPDGSQFFAFDCTSFSTTDPSDPLPATKHMALILNISGTFYPFVANSFTLPMGISNASAFIQVNDSAITNNAGSYKVCVTVVNNQAITWTYTFDFTISDGTWIRESTSLCNWVAGSGWQAGDDNDGGSSASFRRIYLQRSFTASTITKIEVEFSYLFGVSISTTNLAYRVRYGLSGTNHDLVSDPFSARPSDGNQDILYPIASNADFFDIYIATDDQATSGFTPTGAATLSKIVVTGSGTNPFL